MRMKSIILAFILYASFDPSPAVAHCYEHWYYPWPQHCKAGVAKQVNARDLKSLDRKVIRVQPPSSAPIQHAPEFVMPDMSAAWETPGITKELYDGLERKRAIIILQGNYR